MKFDVVKKGYNKEQVHEYIQTITNENNDIITGLKSEIDELKKQKDELAQIVAGYEKKKNEIFVAFVEAQESSAKLKARAEKRFEAEMERLQLFKQKWTEYAKQMARTLAPEQVENFAKATQKFEEILSLYAKESEVLPSQNIAEKPQQEKTFDPLKKVEKFLNNFNDDPVVPQSTVQNASQEVAGAEFEQIVEPQFDDVFEQAQIEISQAEIEEEIAVIKAPLELEEVAEELVDMVDVEQVVVQEPEKQEDIQQKVEKLFEEENKVLQIENNDIEQNEIYNVQQSLEDLCKELGLID